MSFNPGKDWSKESDDLFIHSSGTRIAKATYHGQAGWFIFPLDLDTPAIPFAPTDAGRDEAFAAFAKGLPKKAKPKKAPEEAKGKKAKAEKPPAEEEEPEAEGDEPEGDEDDDEGGDEG